MFRFASRVSRLCLALLSFVVLIHFAAPVHAATYVVDTTSDSAALTACTSAANDCSLRGAINDANAGGTNTITFDASTNGTAITLGSALPWITDDLTITGNGAANTIIDGASSYRVFYIDSSKTVYTVHLSDLTVQNGYVANNGAGIDNEYGTLTVTNSTFSGNSTDEFGGGIYNYGTLTVTSSTFSGNSAKDGGGIFSETTDGSCTDAPLAYIANSTFSGNSATDGGGGINNYNGVAALVYNTVSGNSSGGGVSSFNDENTCTIAAGNIIFGNTGYDVSANTGPPAQRFGSLGYNLVGVEGSNVDFTREFNAAGDLTGSYDPLLGALADNGGTTQTMLPGTGSPAINAGDNALAVDANGNPLITDQRGYPRISGGTVDIGAVEVQLPVTEIPTLSWQALAALGLILAALGLLLASKARSS